MLNHNKICQKKPGPNDLPPNPLSACDAIEAATPIVIDDLSSRKRRREDEESAQITVANTYTPWEKAELSSKIQKIISQLQNAREEVSEVLKLHGPDSASSSNHHSNTASDQHLRTSSLLSRKVYGRIAEKIFIKNLILEDESDGVRVLPIVGIAGVGKTTLAQFVYNDPEVESQFQHRIWVWVSRNFDEVRLTREMLDFVSQERHDGISSFAKLQEILKNHVTAKRILLIFDDVWNDMKDCRWDKLLAPFVSGQVNGIVILVTTRDLSVAKRLGTLKAVKLGALKHEDFWLLFKSRAFGDENYEGPRNLSTIGLKIAEKLKGNLLAAVSVATLLKEHLTVDHWSNILQKEDWKSLGLVEGIMPALKLSYDELPYHLQLCFLYCSIFSNKHKFLGKELVCIWISQGFVTSTCLNKRLEETGWEYLTDLVNQGFFQQVEQEEFLSADSQIWYSTCGLMHDFARILSRIDCATIDGLQCNKMLASIQHLSIVTDSAYNSKDQHQNISRNEKFEENLKNAVTSVGRLRTLVLLGNYDSHFFQVFREKFRMAHSLRLLQMSATSADFNSLACSLANTAHLRYLKRESDEVDGAFPQTLHKLYHLQVLVDVRSNNDPTMPNGLHNLVSLRHLVVHKGVYSSIGSIGNMTSIQELYDFKLENSSGFEIAQLQSMKDLVLLGVSQLDHVKTREEAYGAGLRNKEHLEELRLSWGSDTSSEHSTDKGQECLPEDATKEVLEGLEPHMDLKHLHISGYNGTTSPSWLASNITVTSLQTLQLDDSGGWRILPSLESLPFLTKLKLSSIREVREILVPSLQELVLVQMPKLVRCSSTSVEGLDSSLRVLQIEDCLVMKEFDLFEKDHKFDIEQRSWLPGLRKIILRRCPQLEVLKPLPPSTTVSEFLISGVSTLPYMKGSSDGTLHIANLDDGDEDVILYGYSGELRVRNIKNLAFHNMKSIKFLTIADCQNLSYISFQDFSQLVSLKMLQICRCNKLFSSDVMPDATHTAANCTAFPSLEILSIKSCRLAVKWLSLLLRHAPDLERLHLDEEEEEEKRQSNQISAWEDPSSGKHDDASIGLSLDGLIHSSLKKIIIQDCPRLTFNWSDEDLSGFTSLQELSILDCHDQLPSLVHKDASYGRANRRLLLPKSLEELWISYNSPQKTLQPCFPSDLTSLKNLKVGGAPGLESLQLRSCTALEELTVEGCESLNTLDGLQSLGGLRHLAVYDCPAFRLESISRQGNELCSRLETLAIDDPYVLTTSFCSHLTSLRRLELQHLVLTEEQGRALLLLKSLQQLKFFWCSNLLVDIPAGLHVLPSLKRLDIRGCSGISRLPETGLPLSLEELEIGLCSNELTNECRLLATNNPKLKVRIDED